MLDILQGVVCKTGFSLVGSKDLTIILQNYSEAREWQIILKLDFRNGFLMHINFLVTKKKEKDRRNAHEVQMSPVTKEDIKLITFLV